MTTSNKLNLLELHDDILTKINNYVEDHKTLGDYFKIYQEGLIEVKKEKQIIDKYFKIYYENLFEGSEDTDEETAQFEYEFDLENSVDAYFEDY